MRATKTTRRTKGAAAVRGGAGRTREAVRVGPPRARRRPRGAPSPAVSRYLLSSTYETFPGS